NTDGVDRFIRTVGTPEQAQALLGQRIAGRLGAAISSMSLDDLIHVATPEQVSRRSEKLRDKLIGAPGAEDDLRQATRSDYGIEIVEVRLRRFNYPASVRPSIYDRIISERAKKTADYQGEGLRRAEEIKATADREVRTVLADARADEQRLKK